VRTLLKGNKYKIFLLDGKFLDRSPTNTKLVQSRLFKRMGNGEYAATRL